MFGDVEYWNSRYTKLGGRITFDYLVTFRMLSGIGIFEYANLETNSKILVVGCGNSPFSEELYDYGSKNIVNIDYSRVVINQMRERNTKLRSSMKYYEIDARNLHPFGDESWDIIFDKGLLDCLLCGEEAFLSSFYYLSELQRILSSSGTIIIVSNSASDRRLLHFKRENMSFNVEVKEYLVNSGDLVEVGVKLKEEGNTNNINRESRNSQSCHNSLSGSANSVHIQEDFSSENKNSISFPKSEGKQTSQDFFSEVSIEVKCYIYLLTKNKDWKEKNSQNFSQMLELLSKQDIIEEIVGDK
mmetsp:Transcript_24709/g.25812  ORF Transcript_24709/g.25812 Transcript_24709/m.25812 type:complete len:301 (-) Transcript_24709:28-930(-)